MMLMLSMKLQYQMFCGTWKWRKNIRVYQNHFLKGKENKRNFGTIYQWVYYLSMGIF